jgi:hypothetical protein
MLPDVAPHDGEQTEPQRSPPHVSLGKVHEMAPDSEYRPFTQSRHSPNPASPLYLPTAQSMQAEPPVDITYFPTGHSMHSTLPVVAPTSVIVYLPAIHIKQADAAYWSLYLPLAHVSQLPSDK